MNNENVTMPGGGGVGDGGRSDAVFLVCKVSERHKEALAKFGDMSASRGLRRQPTSHSLRETVSANTNFGHFNLAFEL